MIATALPSPARWASRSLCLVRHGITAPQEEHRYCGHSNPSLSRRGVEQMCALRARLTPALLRNATVFSSDLRRAMESAEILTGSVPGFPLMELREIDFGEWEGKRFDQTGCANAECLRDRAFRFPGGETIDDLRVRVGRAWQRMRNEMTTSQALVVAHGGSLAALLVLLRGQAEEEIWNERLPHGGAIWWTGDFEEGR